MNSTARIISNLINEVGCSGLRSLADLGRMRLATLRGRVSGVEKMLPVPSIISIFIAWLQAKAMQVEIDTLPLEEWCRHLVHAYGCSESEVLWYWDSSEWALWGHLSTTSRLPDVRRRMESICRAIREIFARDGHGSVCVRGNGRRQAQTSCGASSWHPPDDLRRGARGDRHDGDDLRDPTPEKPGATRPSRDSAVLRTGDGRDISARRLADETDWDARSADSATRSGLDTTFFCRRGNRNNPGRAMSQCLADEESPRNYIPPVRYICNLCGTWGTHYVWDCTEKRSTRYQTAVNGEMRPADAGRKDNEKTQGTRFTAVNPERSGPFAAEMPRRDFRPSSAPGASWAPNHLNRDVLAERPLSHETKRVKSPDKRDEYQVNAQAVAEELEELSAADEVALQCADEFLCRLERALKRKYQTEVEHDLMFWDDKIPGKKPRIEAATDHVRSGDGDGATGHVHFFDAAINVEAGAVADVDAASIPCPASVATTGSSESEVSPSVRKGKQSDIFCNRMTNKPYKQNLLPGLSWGSAAREPRNSAIELWQANIDFKAAKASEYDG
ncbi:hypothetical protein E4U53_004625 [Claviceps sorghi]|nr:hypothetical protein E4U53_004625 [Claviceps sorghi]